jgi:hypothetical protein
MEFFERYDLFLKTSPVGNWPARLNGRYRAIIDANRDALAGARVLDLASHDGRWSFAALEAGASVVTGVEVRPELVDAARQNMRSIGVHPDRYRFLQGDMFERRGLFQRPFDVVMCLGIFYHTTRHTELLELMGRTGASTIILDTMIANTPGCLSLLQAESSEPLANGLDDTGVRNGKILVAHPSPAAIELMFKHFGYAIRRIDWPSIIAEMGVSPDLSSGQSAQNPLGDYARNLRGTFIATRLDPAKTQVSLPAGRIGPGRQRRLAGWRPPPKRSNLRRK